MQNKHAPGSRHRQQHNAANAQRASQTPPLSLTFPKSAAHHHRAAVQSNEVYPTPPASARQVSFGSASDKRFPLGVMKALSSEVNPRRKAGAITKRSEIAISPLLRRSLQVCTTAVLRAKPQECKVSARADARSRVNASQSVGPQPHRVCTDHGSRKSSVAVQGGLRLQWRMYQSLSSQGLTPNPSIEGTHKRLRLLRPPHVKR